MPKEPSLKELQRWMRWAIVDPRGTQSALSDPNPGPEVLRERLPVAMLTRFCAPSPSAEDYVVPTERLTIYAEAFFDRLVEAVQGDFTATLALLGEDRFRELMSEYLCTYPSRSYTAADVGKRLSLFVSESRWDAFAGLADAARLDWARLESFYSAHAPEFDLAAFFAGLSEEDAARVKLELSPSLRLVSSGTRYWCVAGGEAQEIPAVAWRVLEALRAGKALGELDSQTLGFSEEEINRCFGEFFPIWAANRIVVYAHLPV